MKKLLTACLALMVLAAFVAAPTASFACGGDKANAEQASAKSTCTASKANATQASAKSGCTAEKANATQASAKSGCTAAQNANATLAGAKGSCAAKNASMASAKCDISECAAKMGMSVEECKEMCSKYSLVNMNINGMTCGGCEQSVKACLELVPGVVKVAKVCHKAGTAMVWTKPNTVDGQTLVTAVSNKGYEAEIIPAVATMTTDAPVKAAGATKSCASTCTAAKKANATQASAKDSK